MPTATITVKFVNQPKAGKKFGSINTAEMGYFGVEPSKLGLFSQGQTYTIEYEQKGEYKDFKAIVASAAGGKDAAAEARDQTSERIYVCGILNAAIASGKLEISAETLTQATRAARAAWTATFGANEDAAPF